MHRVRPGVASLLGDLLGLDDFHNLRLARVWLGVEDVNARLMVFTFLRAKRLILMSLDEGSGVRYAV
jgi:hypothetical protein